MKIQVDKLSNHLEKLLTIENKYNNFYLNYYNEIFKLQSYWTTTKGIVFFENVNIEKKDFNNFLLNLKEIRKIYFSLEKEYKIIGNEIEYYADEYDRFLSKIGDFNNKLEKIVNKYQNLNYKNIDYNIKENLLNEKEKILDSKSNLKKIKSKNKSIINKIVEKEKRIKSLITKIDINYIKEININEYKNTKVAFSNLNIVDSNKIEQVLKFLKNYISDEKILLDDLRNCYEKINLTYDSSNLKYIKQLESDLLMNIKVLINNHNNEIVILEKEIINIRDVEDKMDISFKNLGKDIKL